MEIQKIATEKWSLEDGTEYHPWEMENQSPKAPLDDRNPVRKDMNVFALFLNKFGSNPFLIDLPPPTPQI